MSTEHRHSHMWHRLSPEAQAAVDRTVAKFRPADELDPEHCRRLATLLGLCPRGTAAARAEGGDGG